MSEEQIKNILSSINYEVETDKNWVEPIGLDRDAWKALLKYIQQKENIINKAVEYHDNCINNLLDLNKIDNNEKLAYKVAYEIHDNYLNILKGDGSNE